MTNDKPAREFWIEKGSFQYRCVDNNMDLLGWNADGKGAIHVIEHSAYQALKLENERLNGSVAFDFDRLKHDEASYYKDMVTRLNAVIDKLKAENAELLADKDKFKKCYDISDEAINRDLLPMISNLQSEVARLRELGLKMASYITDVGQYEAGDQFREALNHKPKGEKE